METRTLWSKVTFPQPFTLPGSDTLLPAGEYDLLIEEEHLQGLTFDAYRRTGAFLRVAGKPGAAGRTELRPVSEADLDEALGPDPVRPGPPILPPRASSSMAGIPLRKDTT